jgi:membrane-bound metal-dependent hydrolase YbcI (DUF457 family)
MLIQTHFFLALAMGYVLKLPAKAIVIGGVLPDVDTAFTAMGLGFPFMHRGFLHTPIILGIIMIGIYLATRNPSVCAGFGAGFLSHLFIDTVNPTGIMWLYPFPTFFTLNLATYSNAVANYGIIAWSVAFILIFNPHFIARLNLRKLGINLKGIK